MPIRTLDQFRAWARSHAKGLVYAGPDPHHGLGLDHLVPDCRMSVVDWSPAAKILRARGSDVFAQGEFSAGAPDDRTTLGLLSDDTTREFIERRDDTTVLVFKNSHSLESLCLERGWKLAAAPSRMARRWENKLRFTELANAAGVPLPKSASGSTSTLEFSAIASAFGVPFVLQSAHGYGGRRTHLVSTAAELEFAKSAIKAPVCRIATYVPGVPTTINACVTARGVAVGPEIVQITGDPILTPFRLGSCGNDWEAAAKLGFNYEQAADATHMLGCALANDGYLGIFGVDLIRTPDGSPVVIEVNPRLVASIALHTQAEIEQGRLPLLARHLLAFMAPGLDEASFEEHGQPLRGAQFIANHTQPDPAVVTGSLQTGAISLAECGDGQAAVRPALHVSEIRAPSDALVLAPASGRRLKLGSEYLRLQIGAAPGWSADGLPDGVESAIRRLTAACFDPV